MARRYHCQDHQDVLELETTVLDARPGAFLPETSPFFPGGGGQMADRGNVDWNSGSGGISGFQLEGGDLWHVMDGDAVVGDTVRLTVDPEFRQLMCRLHTAAHIANAIVYQALDGALLTGAQLAENGTLRVDFDLPETDNDRLRALEAPINDAIGQNLEVSAAYMAWDEANAIAGMFRSKAVAPPMLDDGTVRIVEIAGLDRQACGGTHVTGTGDIPPIRVLKVENKGRHNRRLRLGFSA